jgi:S1-C subfamily serine protease/peroxiredoxin
VRRSIGFAAAFQAVCSLCFCLTLAGCVNKVSQSNDEAPQVVSTPAPAETISRGSDEPAGVAKQNVAKPSLSDVIARAQQSIVRVNVSSSSGAVIGHGSGFVIDPRGYVATNYHVTRLGSKVVVQFRDGTRHEVKGYRALDREGDIAILELAASPKDHKALPLAKEMRPRQGDNVTAFGHPGGFEFSISPGIVSAVRKTSELPREVIGRLRAPAHYEWIQTTAPISPGSSGGPLLDESGQVVGICTWIAEGQNLGFCVHIRHVADLLASAPTKTIPLVAESLARNVENPLEQMQPRIQELLKDYQQANIEFRRLLEQAKDKEDFRRIYEKEQPYAKFAKRFYEIADSNRRSLVAFQALFLACRFDAEATKAEYLLRALDRLIEDHAADKGMEQIVVPLFNLGHQAVPDFLRRLIAKSPHLKVRGLGSLSLALFLTQKEGSDDAEAIRLLESCQNEYKDVPAGEQTLGQVAKPLLFKLRFLSVGKKPPEIKGRDVDGKEFKLSDYRGKVVLIDFFADWCPHCSRMYPHERKLMEQYRGQSFVIVGVNTDSLDTLRQLVKDKKVAWRCWSDGQEGPIAEQWQIASYPTLFLLDHEGVIRQVISGSPDEQALEKTIRDLVERAKKGSVKSDHSAPR